MSPRREFSAKVKVAAFERSGGYCEKCTARLVPGRYAYDHVLPDALGGEPTLANCEVLCDACHGAKTHRDDVPRIAKMKRQRARHIGAEARSPRPLPGGRKSPWRKKIDGTVVRRDT
jgi:5-methylcytosine-specific restriction enzyme A